MKVPMKSLVVSTRMNSRPLFTLIMYHREQSSSGKKEFQDLKQGTMTVSEYVIRFMQLSYYAPNDVDTDEKKQECFLNGLNDGLAYALEARHFANFQAMVNKPLILENCRAILECKHK
jgi:hypothetical protein